MLKIAIASLFTKNKMYAGAEKIQGYEDDEGSDAWMLTKPD